MSIPDDPSNTTVHANGIVPGGNPIVGTLLLVTGAVVPIFTVMDCAPLSLICTDELDRLHVGCAQSWRWGTLAYSNRNQCSHWPIS